MKKIILCLFFVLSAYIFSNEVHAIVFPNPEFKNYPIKFQYIKLQDKITQKFGTKTENLSNDDKNTLNIKLNDIKDLFIQLDTQVTLKNKKEAGYTITELKKLIIEMILFVKNAQNKVDTIVEKQTSTTEQTKTQVNLNQFASDSKY